MSEKKVVFLRSNPVDPDSRVEKEVNTLAKAGYQVSVIAWDRSAKYHMKENALKHEDCEVAICRFGIPASFGGGIRSLGAFITFQMRLLVWLFANRNSYGIIHACDFDTAFTAFISSKLLKKKIIFDIFDYIYSNITGKFKLFKRLIRAIQNAIINGADGTIICTEQRKMQIIGTMPKRLAIVHNSPPSIELAGATLPLDSQKIKIAYIGILQDYRLLIEMTEAIMKKPDCELHIGGFGKYDEYFQNASSQYPNIIYYGKVPYAKTLEIESSCDIMTAIYDPTLSNHYFAAPNKFYESLMLGKPLIMVKNTGMSDVIAKYEVGELIEYNAESFVQAVDKLSAKKHLWPEMSYKMKQIYNQDYSWSEMEKRLLKLYRDINT